MKFEPDWVPQLAKKDTVLFNRNFLFSRTVLYGYWSIKTVSVLHVLDKNSKLHNSFKMGKGGMHDPVSCNCAVSMPYTYIIFLPHNLNSTKLHLQGVAPRSQDSDHAPEAVTLQ